MRKKKKGGKALTGMGEVLESGLASEKMGEERDYYRR